VARIMPRILPPNRLAFAFGSDRLSFDMPARLGAFNRALQSSNVTAR